ncbi:hypothetical protein DVH26_05025 [Paenibacillus sp. H1-7]|nr:hypothetical protein DVH26_05025 [Paenibacillus sp. H1-7]
MEYPKPQWMKVFSKDLNGVERLYEEAEAFHEPRCLAAVSRKNSLTAHQNAKTLAVSRKNRLTKGSKP